MKNVNHFQLLIRKLEYLKYSENTVKIYSHYIKEFINHVNIFPSKMNSGHFQTYIDEYRFTSTSQQNQIISAIKLFYEKVLNKKYSKIDFTRPRKEKSLPQIIEKEFLLSRIKKIENLKHKTTISLAYSTGMRVSEIINLKIEDIDSKRMVINLKNGKGKKDRTLPLSGNILALLRVYYKKYKPKVNMFNGQNSLKYSSTSCNKIVKKYLGEKYHFHQLRHSCATSLLESGVNLRIIQKILGHNSVKTVEIYTHVSTNLLNSIPLPI